MVNSSWKSISATRRAEFVSSLYIGICGREFHAKDKTGLILLSHERNFMYTISVNKVKIYIQEKSPTTVNEEFQGRKDPNSCVVGYFKHHFTEEDK